MKELEERGSGADQMVPSPLITISRRDFVTRSLLTGIGVMSLGLLDGSFVYADSLGSEMPQGTLNSLHVSSIATNGVIWHTIRQADGSWIHQFGNVNDQERNGRNLRFKAIDCATEGSDLHVVAIATNGVIWHTIRFVDGTWVSAFGNVNDQESNGRSLRFIDVGCGGTPTNKLHVVAVDTHGIIWHTIRQADGSWVSGFGNVNDQESNGSSLRFKAVNCATVGEDLHVVAIGTDDVIWHTIRFADGTWVSQFGNVNDQESNGGSLRFIEVDCDAIGGDLHVVAVATNHVIWHTIRFVDGTWVSAFGNVNDQERNGSLRFTGVDCANAGNALHVGTVATNGVIWHTIRFSDGTWQSEFGNVNDQESNGRQLRFGATCVAGVV